MVTMRTHSRGKHFYSVRAEKQKCRSIFFHMVITFIWETLIFFFKLGYSCFTMLYNIVN